MKIKVFTDSSKNAVQGVYMADTTFAEQQWSGRWEEVVEVPDEPVVVPPVYEWYIDVGPFFDRFGAKKLAVLMSTDATVQAVLKDVQIRKWIDLQRADVAQTLDLFISKGLIDAADKTAILTTPVDPMDNLALRKSYFA